MGIKEDQERDRLLGLACKYCWNVPDYTPLPETMRPKLEVVGVIVPDEIINTGEFVDHYDSQGIYLPRRK